MTNTITEAADMIAEFSPVTAAAFRARPFHRVALAVAFEAGFRTHNDLTRKVCAFVLVAAKADQLDRAIAAANKGRDMTDLTEHMRRALAAIRAQGDTATPEGGGWWKGARGERLRHANVKLGDEYTEPVVTFTIYALARRGVLVRTKKYPQAWRDTYKLAEGVT